MPGKGHMPLPPAGSGTLALATPEPVAFGDSITFAFTGTDELKNPRIWVDAFQDGVRVYGEGIGAAETAVLGGGSSDWVEKGGGPADCVATLYYIPKANGNSEWNGHGGQGPHVTLAVCEFHAEG